MGGSLLNPTQSETTFACIHRTAVIWRAMIRMSVALRLIFFFYKAKLLQAPFSRYESIILSVLSRVINILFWPRRTCIIPNANDLRISVPTFRSKNMYDRHVGNLRTPRSTTGAYFLCSGGFVTGTITLDFIYTCWPLLS
jgi:hypothetical protein